MGVSEFCFECYKTLIDPEAKKENLVISNEDDLCEGCGEYKPVVIKEGRSLLRRLIQKLFNGA